VGCWFTPALLHKDTVDSSPHWDSLGLFVKKVFAKIPFLDRLDTPPAQMLSTGSQSNSRKAQTLTCNFCLV